MLLAFDAYFIWYHPIVDPTVPFMGPMPSRRTRALDNACAAVDMFEIVERVTIHHHKSFLFHGAVYKVSRDILRVNNTGAVDPSALELQNAETKRVASNGGSRHIVLQKEGQWITPKHSTTEGPSNLIQTKGVTTTSAISTLRKLTAKRYLTEGHGLYAMPASRRNDRLFGEHAIGRSSASRVAHACMKLVVADYNPRMDTCVKALVRMLAELAMAGDNQE